MEQLQESKKQLEPQISIDVELINKYSDLYGVGGFKWREKGSQIHNCL